MEMPKKIAIDIRVAGGEKTGKGWYTFNLVKNLLKLDEKNQYILYSKEKILGFDEFKNAELRLISGNNLTWHFSVAKDISEKEIDVFFAPSSYIIPSLIGNKIKTIITVHDLVAFLFPNKHNKKAVILEKLFLKRAIKKSKIITTVSENTKNDLLQIKKRNIPGLSEKLIDPYNSDKIKVISCSAGDEFKEIPTDLLKNFIVKTNLPNKFFLAVGTLEPRKNYVNLIKAFAFIKEKYPNCHLIIIGQKGWDYEEVFSEVKRYYLNKNVHFLGYLSMKSLVSLYNLAVALVFPSLYEGFGIPPLEAMKCGCPVIGSNISSIPEVIEDAGILINPKKPKEIAIAMEKLLIDESLREKLQEEGFKQAEKFSWEKSAEEFLKILKKI